MGWGQGAEPDLCRVRMRLFAYFRVYKVRSPENETCIYSCA